MAPKVPGNVLANAKLRPPRPPRRRGHLSERHRSARRAIPRPRPHAGGRCRDHLDGPSHTREGGQGSPVRTGRQRHERSAVRDLALRGEAGVAGAAEGAVAPPDLAGPAAAGELRGDAAGAAERGVVDPRVLSSVSRDGEELLGMCVS